MPKVILILLCLLFPPSAMAHSPLSNVSPKDGAKLEDTLTEISMVFKSPAKLIKLQLLKEKTGGKKLDAPACGNRSHTYFKYTKGKSPRVAISPLQLWAIAAAKTNRRF